MSNPLGAHYPFPSIPHHWAQASFQPTIHLHLASPSSILRHFHFLPEDGQLDIWLGLFTRRLGVKGCLTVGHTQSAKHAFVGPRGVGAPSATGRVHGIVPASRGPSLRRKITRSTWCASYLIQHPMDMLPHWNWTPVTWNDWGTVEPSETGQGAGPGSPESTHGAN